MGIPVTAEEASRIISLKYPDLSDGFEYEPWKKPPPQQRTPPRSGRKRSLNSSSTTVLCQRLRLGKREHEDDHHDGRYRAVNFKSPQRSSNVELVYPSMYSAEDHLRYMDQDSFVLSRTPLRADKYSSMTQDPGSTPSVRKHKRPRLRGEIASVSCQFGASTGGGGIKRTISRLCGASRSIFSNKYTGIPG